MLVITKAEPEAAFGFHAGAVSSMYLLTQGVNLMLAQFFDGVKLSGTGGVFISAPYLGRLDIVAEVAPIGRSR